MLLHRGKLYETRSEIEEEIEHQRQLLRQATGNLRFVQNRMASLGVASPLALPLHNEAEEMERRRTEALQVIRELEQQVAMLHATPRAIATPAGAASPEQTTPRVTYRLLYRTIPTAVMHLYSREQLPLVAFRAANRTSAPCALVVTSQIEQYSFSRSDTLYLSSGAQGTVAQLPVLRLDEIRRIQELTRGVLHLRATYIVNGQEALLWVQDEDVQFLARDVMTWAIVVDERRAHDLSHHIAAWVQPNDPAIADLARAAKDYLPRGMEFGYWEMPRDHAENVRQQVQAIFAAIQARSLEFIHAPVAFGLRETEIHQTVHLPAFSLAHRQANCIDFVVLYASLMERVGLHPAILIVPGHALVGWETWPDSGQYEFLETTWSRASYTFDAALAQGNKTYYQFRAFLGRPIFDPRGFALLHDLRRLRAQGVTPMA
ncbi:MAG: hypothetical protein IT330_08975 [Anaerolineae bacterium]|nr:hypothetical protein [Anaerolineae bacterium]